MTPQERRGKLLFLILATLIIIEKLSSVGFALSGEWAQVNWYKSVIQPLVFAVMFGFLWEGENWLRWLIGGLCVVSGGPVVVSCALIFIKLAGMTPPEATGFFIQVIGYPLGFVGLFGMCYLLTGLMLLFLPSLKAFFRYQRYQRERPRFSPDEESLFES